MQGPYTSWLSCNFGVLGGDLRAVEGASVITSLTTLLVALEAQDVPNPQTTLLNALGLDPTVDLTNFVPVSATLATTENGQATFAAGAIVVDTITLIVAMIGSNDFENVGTGHVRCLHAAGGRIRAELLLALR